jgi:hypothetical protein
MEASGINELAAGTVGRPTVASGMNVRWRIFFLILGTVAINYIHRASLSVAMQNQPRVYISPAIQASCSAVSSGPADPPRDARRSVLAASVSIF